MGHLWRKAKHAYSMVCIRYELWIFVCILINVRGLPLHCILSWVHCCACINALLFFLPLNKRCGSYWNLLFCTPHVCMAFCTILYSLHCAANWEGVNKSAPKVVSSEELPTEWAEAEHFWIRLLLCLLCSGGVSAWVGIGTCKDLPDMTVLTQGSPIIGFNQRF